MNKALIAIFITCINYTLVFANDYNFLLDIIKKDEILSSGNIGFINYGEKNYIVSVGISPIIKYDPANILNARKQAKILAEKEIMKFIHDIQIKSEEVLISEMGIIVFANPDGTKISKRKITEKYKEIIQEKGSGLINKTINIGKWKSKDKKDYFYAIGILID